LLRLTESLTPHPDQCVFFHTTTFSCPDFLLTAFQRICRLAPPGGCFIASTDVMLLMDQDVDYQWPADGMCGLAIMADKHLGPNHGVFHLDREAMTAALVPGQPQPVTTFVQKGSVPLLTSLGAVHNDRVLLDSGLVYFSAPYVADFLRLFNFHCFIHTTIVSIWHHFESPRLQVWTN
jgi:hypothetical protein